MTESSSDHDFDVALSFAGEDRHYVQQVADLLVKRDVRIFYDEYMASELWGNDLYTVLDEVYRKRARFTVAFVSHAYASKPWTRHERQSAQARALTEAVAYLLPVRLDDSELPGLRPTVAYIDARQTTVERLVDLILQKLGRLPGVASPSRRVLRVPRSLEQQRELLAQRPDGWEYMLYAGVLWQQREALEGKWRDHQLRYARRSGRYMDDADAVRHIHHSTNDMAALADNVTKVLDSKALTAAFGPPGEPGDPALIEHVASRLVSIYEEFIDCAANLRGAAMTEKLRGPAELAARLADRPLEDIRSFIDQMVSEADSIPDRLAAGENGPITLVLELNVDDRLVSQLGKDLRRLRL